jgi:hypothetical protein
MKKPDVKEAVPILDRTMRALLAAVRTSYGREGSDVRRSVGDLLANAEQLLSNDEAGELMAQCFDRARLAGVTMVRFSEIVLTTAAETPVTLGGILTKQCLIQFGLGGASRALVDLTFNSKQEADLVRKRINEMFAIVEEDTADDMDSITYRILVELHAALVSYLVETARPLPRLIRFHFYRPLPTLVIAHKLYDDASRGDELRSENRVVHPAFAKPDGIALSA